MSESVKVLLAAPMLAGIGLVNICLAVTPEDQASIQSQCAREAETYGIPPEQMAEYIDGCILSMGGYLPDPPQQDSGDFAAPAGDAPYDDTFAVEPTEPEAPQEYGSEAQ